LAPPKSPIKHEVAASTETPRELYRVSVTTLTDEHHLQSTISSEEEVIKHILAVKKWK
jgi:hypothetical protein